MLLQVTYILTRWAGLFSWQPTNVRVIKAAEVILLTPMGACNPSECMPHDPLLLSICFQRRSVLIFCHLTGYYLVEKLLKKLEHISSSPEHWPTGEEFAYDSHVNSPHSSWRRVLSILRESLVDHTLHIQAVLLVPCQLDESVFISTVPSPLLWVIMETYKAIEVNKLIGLLILYQPHTDHEMDFTDHIPTTLYQSTLLHSY